MSIFLEALRINRRNARLIDEMRFDVIRQIRWMAAHARRGMLNMQKKRLFPELCCKHAGATWCNLQDGHEGECDDIPF